MYEEEAVPPFNRGMCVSPCFFQERFPPSIQLHLHSLHQTSGQQAKFINGACVVNGTEICFRERERERERETQ